MNTSTKSVMNNASVQVCPEVCSSCAVCGSCDDTTAKMGIIVMPIFALLPMLMQVFSMMSPPSDRQQMF